MSVEPRGDRSAAMQTVQEALRLVCLGLPHLSGLAHVVRISLDDRVPTAGIFASGRMVVNPTWFQQLERPDRTFVMAHELLHLALQTHTRGEGTNGWLVNIAHDYIINDML